MFEDAFIEINDLKNTLVGFTIKRKYRNRKYKVFHKKGILEKMAEDPFLSLFVLPTAAFSIKKMKNIINRKEEKI